MKTILLVEDDEMVGRMYERALGFSGYAMKTVNDGARVADTLGSMDPLPAAIILDVVIPNKSGKEILLDIRADKRYNTIPVVILTNSVRDDIKEEFMNAGADLFLVKMDNQAKDVVQRVQELINHGRSDVHKS